jgi:hypothetical protein
MGKFIAQKKGHDDQKEFKKKPSKVFEFEMDVVLASQLSRVGRTRRSYKTERVCESQSMEKEKIFNI